MSLACLSCQLPDCDDESPACPIRQTDRELWAAKSRRYRNASPMNRALRQADADSCRRVTLAEAMVRRELMQEAS